jgi:hypothetical protein
MLFVAKDVNLETVFFLERHSLWKTMNIY